jgi:hypothetical protein
MEQQQSAYYYKEKTIKGDAIAHQYILILNGQRAGQTPSKREAEAWQRANSNEVAA